MKHSQVLNVINIITYYREYFSTKNLYHKLHRFKTEFRTYKVTVQVKTRMVGLCLNRQLAIRETASVLSVHVKKANCYTFTFSYLRSQNK